MFGRRCSRCNRRCFQQQLLAFPRRYRRCANRLLIFASLGAERDVVAPTSVTEDSNITHRGIIVPGCVVKKCIQAVSRIVVAGGICPEPGTTTGCRVCFADCVVYQRQFSVGCVESTGRIVKERLSASRRIGLSSGVGKKREVAHGRIADPSRIAEECAFANGRVRHTFSVARERSSSIGGVFVAGSVAKERSVTGGRVDVAFGIARKGERSSGRVFLANGIV